MAQRSSPQHRKRRKGAARDMTAPPCPPSDPQAADHTPKGESHEDQRRGEIGQGALSADDVASADDAAPFAQFLKQLALHGNVTKAAEQAKLSLPAVRAHRRRDASFDEAIKEALIEAADRLLYIARARHKHLMIAAESQQAWQAAMAAASGQSWKDEAWTLSFIIILAMCFIPPLQPYLAEGFAILDTTPEWFRWAMLASIGASFGLRGFDRFTGRK